MTIELNTAFHHGHNADGIERGADEWCPGCWDFFVDEANPQRSYAACNECGERRPFRAPGIDAGDAFQAVIAGDTKGQA